MFQFLSRYLCLKPLLMANWTTCEGAVKFLKIVVYFLNFNCPENKKKNSKCVCYIIKYAWFTPENKSCVPLTTTTDHHDLIRTLNSGL